MSSWVAWPFHATELSECSSAPAAMVFPVCPRSACYVHSIINRSLSTLRLWLALSCAGSWLPWGGGASLQGVPRPEHVGLKRSRGTSERSWAPSECSWDPRAWPGHQVPPTCGAELRPCLWGATQPRITGWLGSECSTLLELKDSMCNLPIECWKWAWGSGR